MSDDPDQPSASEPTPPKPTDSAAESADAVRLKRRFKRGGTESEEGEKSDQTIQMLSTLLQDLIAKKELPGAPETEAKTAKYHRLSKTGSAATAGTPELTATVPPPSPDRPSAATPAPAVATPALVDAPPPLPPASPVHRPTPVFELEAMGRKTRRLHILYCLVALLLAAGGYYAGTHHGVPGAHADASGKLPLLPAGAWDDAMLKQLDQALAADQAGDLKGAQRLASAIKKPATAAPSGLDLYLAGLNTRLEHTYDAEADLLRDAGNAPPEEAAVINQQLAFNFSRARDFEKSSDFYKVAGRIDPFSASLFYHWGEVLRHLGRFQEASAEFHRALERVPTGQPETESLRECINLKLRLTLVEEGRDAEFQQEMTEQLKAPAPSGYWLLTAAAVALQHNNLPEAAGYLGRARDALGKTQLDALLDDYFFRAFADRKELVDFFPSDTGAARRARLLPTMTYSIEP